ncbi:MAG TPA: hypothetical protein VKR06_35135 [Ktedonosporobacter sp.]|nr:hypothetical protein [Ktedonosporobacter sp.]
MNQSTHGGLHCSAAPSSDDQICRLCGNTLQTQDDQPSRICGSALQIQIEDDGLLKEDRLLSNFQVEGPSKRALLCGESFTF